VEQDFIAGQELSDVHGSYTGQPVMGAIGGIIGQMFVVFSIFKSLGLGGEAEGLWSKK